MYKYDANTGLVSSVRQSAASNTFNTHTIQCASYKISEQHSVPPNPLQHLIINSLNGCSNSSYQPISSATVPQSVERCSIQYMHLTIFSAQKKRTKTVTV
jgi:hypothetical protein